MSHLLRSTEAKIETASNGREGVDKALSKKYDLVLMDLQMPILDGFGAIAQLKSHKYDVPVIALTAHAMKEERRRCLDFGFVEHLSKPVDRQLLIRAISIYTQS